jgi:hypothetical protein
MQITAIPQFASVTKSAPDPIAKPSLTSNRVVNDAAVVDVTPANGVESTTVGGKNYALSVEQAGGTYVASVPNPPGISATGSSVELAEDNLNTKLDTLA